MSADDASPPAESRPSGVEILSPGGGPVSLLEQAPEELSALSDALDGLSSELRLRFPRRREPGEGQGAEGERVVEFARAARARSTAGPSRASGASRTAGRAREGEDFDFVASLNALAISLGAPSDPAEWMELFDTVRKRAGSIGMVERSAEVDDFGFEPTVLESVRPLFDFLVDGYWRVRFLGSEFLPRQSQALFVANRAGLLPYDGLVLSHALERERLPGGRPRFLVADWLVTLPFAQANLARIGGVRACRENADRLLRHGHSVIAFPEGMKGAAKFFRERYQLQRFGRGGAVRAALENGVPLVPIGIVGPEEAHPLLAKSTTPGALVGLPFVPVTPTFPWLGPLGLLPLPTQWVIAVGEPMDLSAYSPADAEDPLLVDRLNESLRERIRDRIRFALEQRETVWG